MPDYEKANLFRPNKRVSTPRIDSYEVISDRTFIGYRVKLNWKYENLRIIGFRVWRAVSKKVMLKRNYVIPQIGLERLTGLKNFHVPNTTLFNKQYFSENSKVKFFESNSNRFLKQDEQKNLDFNRFQEIGFVKRDALKNYEFVDKKIKFGETYIYIISAITTSFYDSPKSRPATVRVEDLEHPDPPRDVRLTSMDNSILVSISTEVRANDVKGFVIYRRDQFRDNFEKIQEIIADEQEFVSFVDNDVVPGRAYFYKVYSVDFFDNLSLSAEEKKIVYDVGFPQKKDIPTPTVKIEIDSGNVIITGKQTHPDIIGHKVERRDTWRFERRFGLKTFKGINAQQWPNVNLFKSGSSKIVDNTANQNRIYQYRISSIQKNGQPSTFYISPHIRIEDGLILSGSQIDIDDEPTDLTNFSLTVDDVKQKPIFTKFSWNIEGPWDYLVVEISKGSSTQGVQSSDSEIINLRVDNVHKENSIYYCGLKKEFSYTAKVKVYNGRGDLLDETTQAQMTRISI